MKVKMNSKSYTVVPQITPQLCVLEHFEICVSRNSKLYCDLTAKNPAVDPLLRQPYLMECCFERSSADSMGDSMRSTENRKTNIVTVACL